MVLRRELTALGRDCGYSILNFHVPPKQRRSKPDAVMQYETASGEQAQVDWAA